MKSITFSISTECRVCKAEGRRQKAEVANARSWISIGLTSALCFLTSAFVTCHREQRALTTQASGAARPLPVRVGDLQPGPKMQPATALNNPYEGNAYALSRGQQLFDQYNCGGCHFHAGGGIGPPLMDNEWIYGSSPANIYASITQGRPNGMPSYGGHIPEEHVWQIVTYVRSLGGLEPQGATSPRTDQMQPKRAEEPRR
jgi:cytochrome c oxidase cbb3-type subunit 3